MNVLITSVIVVYSHLKANKKPCNRRFSGVALAKAWVERSTCRKKFDIKDSNKDGSRCIIDMYQLLAKDKIYYVVISFFNSESELTKNFPGKLPP